jgi:hypothetical protein
LSFIARPLFSAAALLLSCAGRPSVFFVGTLALFDALLVALRLQQAFNFLAGVTSRFLLSR